jgi:hypothetical protein
MLEQDPFASSVPQHLKVKTNKRDRKKQVSYISRVKTYREITYCLYIEADIVDPSASRGKKSKKGNNYRTEKLTCGTHFAAASSTLKKAQGIERKSKVARNQRSKINPRNEMFIVHRG